MRKDRLGILILTFIVAFFASVSYIVFRHFYDLHQIDYIKTAIFDFYFWTFSAISTIIILILILKRFSLIVKILITIIVLIAVGFTYYLKTLLDPTPYQLRIELCNMTNKDTLAIQLNGCDTIIKTNLLKNEKQKFFIDQCGDESRINLIWSLNNRTDSAFFDNDAGTSGFGINEYYEIK